MIYLCYYMKYIYMHILKYKFILYLMLLEKFSIKRTLMYIYIYMQRQANTN